MTPDPNTDLVVLDENTTPSAMLVLAEGVPSFAVDTPDGRVVVPLTDAHPDLLVRWLVDWKRAANRAITAKEIVERDTAARLPLLARFKTKGYTAPSVGTAKLVETRTWSAGAAYRALHDAEEDAASIVEPGTADRVVPRAPANVTFSAASLHELVALAQSRGPSGYVDLASYLDVAASAAEKAAPLKADGGALNALLDTLEKRGDPAAVALRACLVVTRSVKVEEAEEA